MKRRGAQTNSQDRLIRQYQILATLSRSQVGRTAVEIEAETSISRSTLYRDLEVLRSAGIPIACTAGRYRFLDARELPPLGLSALQIASLRLARAQLGPVAGTRLLQELDRFLASLKDVETHLKPRQAAFSFADSRKPAPAPAVVRTIEKALSSRKRARIEYRAASRGGVSTSIHIEPLVVAVAEADPYVHAYCVERQGERTYKLSRIASATLTRERATHRPAGGNPFANSVKAWSGAPVRVELRLDPHVAWLAREYPLPGQTERPNLDGSVTITAKVAGVVEAQRRILAWGSAAEVLEPPELREAVRRELAAALGKYDGPGPVKAGKRKSTTELPRALKQGGTGVG